MQNNEELNKLIEEHNESLIATLKAIQDKYGYLSFDTLNYLSEKNDISLEEIYSVATFYNAFKFNARAKYEVNICMGTACYIKGAEQILNKAKELLKIDSDQITSDGKFSIVSTRCIGACGLAPVFKINDEVYGKATPQMLEEILKKYME